MTDEFEVDLDAPKALVGAVPAPADPLADERRRRLEVAPPLAVYVAREVAVTQRMIDDGVFRGEGDPKGRLARTAEHARWRWNGYVACEIDSL